MERRIQAFASTTHYGAELSFESLDNITDGWKALWLVKDWLPDGAEYLTDKALAEKAASLRSLEVLDSKEEESRSVPPAPFTTSSLQQTASTALKFTAKRTMELAQALYEAGAITYHRTDSPNLSDEAITALRAYASEKGLPLPDKPRTWKAKGNAQEAHEAIRPTHVEVEEAGETEEHRTLYRLIRLRALASQLADAVHAVAALRLGADMNGKRAVFEAKGRRLTVPGWKALGIPEDEDNETGEMNNPVPVMKTGSKATALSGRVLLKTTTPPARYTEASLVRESLRAKAKAAIRARNSEVVVRCPEHGECTSGDLLKHDMRDHACPECRRAKAEAFQREQRLKTAAHYFRTASGVPPRFEDHSLSGGAFLWVLPG